jgi:hypothetical protein
MHSCLTSFAQLGYRLLKVFFASHDWSNPFFAVNFRDFSSYFEEDCGEEKKRALTIGAIVGGLSWDVIAFF